MSLPVILWVRDHAPTENMAEQLVLLIIASYGSHSGTRSFPSVRSIARCAKMERKSVQRVITRLAARGVITVTSRQGMNGGYRHNEYTLSCFPQGTFQQGVASSGRQVASEGRKGVASQSPLICKEQEDQDQDQNTPAPQTQRRRNLRMEVGRLRQA